MSKLTLILSSVFLVGTAMAQVPNQVNARRENQQDRIAQGVNSGSLTARETAHLENHEANLNHEIRHDRYVNGGYLTPGQKQLINRQQNNLSRNIYHDKHNQFHQ